jgi:hypothetical protein
MDVKSMPSCTISHNGLPDVSLVSGHQWARKTNTPHLTQTGHGANNLVHHVVDLGFRSETTHAEAERRVRHVLRGAQCAEHVRRLERRRRASAARRQGDVLP